jgi:undecaprenyl-diphosphatase
MRDRRREAVFVVLAITLAAAVESIVKAAVGRARPVFAHPLSHAAGASFPSGHAITSFVAFGLLALLVPRRARLPAALGAVALSALVGFSRIALGVHYVSDVLGAWLLGAAVLVGTEAWFSRR